MNYQTIKLLFPNVIKKTLLNNSVFLEKYNKKRLTFFSNNLHGLSTQLFQ